MLNSNLFWNIVIIISSIIELWSCKKVFDYISEKKTSNFRINMNMIIILLFMLTLLKLNVSPNIRISISIILTFCLYIFNYDSNFYSAIIITLLYWMVLLGIDALSMSTIIWMNSLKFQSNILLPNIYRLESITLGKGLLIINVYIYKLIKSEVKLNKSDISYFFIPVISNIMLFFIIFKYIFKFSDQDLISGFQIVTISIILILSNLSIILVIRKIIKNSILLAEYEVMKRNVNMQYKYYMNLKENQSKIRQLHHDMKNHIICIKKLNENGYDTKQYIETIESKIINKYNLFETGNVLLDIILNDKKEICEDKNIDFKCSINFSKCNFIEPQDICSIFSNILDNSIEACEKINENKRYISLEGKLIEKFFILKAENNKANKINVKNKKLRTDKDDSFLHGLGIKSIETTVKKYNGDIVIDYTDTEFILKLMIPLIQNNN